MTVHLWYAGSEIGRRGYKPRPAKRKIPVGGETKMTTTVIILMQIAAYVLFALAAFVTICWFIGAFDKAERILLALVDSGLLGAAFALFAASTRAPV